MAKWTSLGHGMRRRIGAPSNHIESAGNSMARTHKTSDEAHSDAAAANSVRVPIGLAKTYEGGAGTAVPKKNTQAMDPTAGGKANRTNIENIGATFRIQPKSTFVQLDPAAGPTMASARVIPSVTGRQGFDQEVQSSTL